MLIQVYPSDSAHAIRLLCFYCKLPVDPVRDCWIGHGTMAHYWCTWGVEEALWATVDVVEREEEEADASQSSGA